MNRRIQLCIYYMSTYEVGCSVLESDESHIHIGSKGTGDNLKNPLRTIRHLCYIVG